MVFNIVNTDVHLLLSATFLAEVESVVERNVDFNVSLVALFLSRLIKGLQNLSCSDGEYSVLWGNYTYVIEDIGVVSFHPLMDPETGEKAFHVLAIQWTFSSSRFFSAFEY